MNTLVLLVSLAVITLGAEVLVRSASIVALRAGVSALFVGLTIVGFGTSSPELSASLVATLRGSMGVSVGNVVGSNTFNVAVILALTAVIQPIRVALAAVRRDLTVALVAAFVLLLPMGVGGVVPRWLGAAMVVGLVVYLAVAYVGDRRAGPRDEQLAEKEVRSSLVIAPAGPPARPWFDSTAAHVGLIVVGLLLLVFGAKWFVDAAITIAHGFRVPEDVIGLTIVSAGTSLPELVTSIVAARRGNPDIAIGNVIGSNIFNVLGIAGVCACVAPQTVPPEMLRVDIPVMIVTTLALIPILRSGGRISRGEGFALLAGYGVYLSYLLAARTGGAV